MENNGPEQNAGQGMGIAALILGIIAVLISIVPCVGVIAIVLGLLAIVFGAIGVSQARNKNASTALPQAGFVLGILSIAIVIVVMVFFVAKVSAGIKDVNEKIKRDFDSENAESEKIQDSLDTLETTNDTVTVTVEETR